ncbi:hypothetical protein LCGC14_2817040, partial [marine sediment metagenome]
GATSGTVSWNGQFERFDADSLDMDVDSFAATQSVTDTTAGISGQISVASVTFTIAQADGILANEGFRLLLWRDTSGDLVGDAQIKRVMVRQ